jgi:hypothetical protein
MELNRKLEGGRGRQCVANAALGSSHLTSFRFEEPTLVVPERPPESDNEQPWAHRPDTKMLPMIGNFLHGSSKALLRTSNSKSSTSNARSGRVRCLPRFSACVWQSTGSACGTRPAPTLRVQHVRLRKESLVFPYPHRETMEHRVGSKLQDRPDGAGGRSLPRTTPHCGNGRGDISHQSSRTSSSGPLPTPCASPHRRPLPLPLSL